MKTLKLAAALVLMAAPAFAQTNDASVDPNRITVQMMPGLTSSNQLPTERLINARKALAAGQSIYVSDMRAIADFGDGFAAYRFADWLAENSDDPSYSDIAHYYGIAAATARGGAIRQMIRALDQVNPETLVRARSDVLENILFTYAKAGNALAVEAVIRYDTAQRPFGRLGSEVATLLDHIDGENAVQVSLHLAAGILQNPQATQFDLDQAQTYLDIAMSSQSLESRLVASNLAPLLDEASIKLTSASTETSQ
ncbi:hypothetical protein [Yoonia sp. BS5-3]|uniref:Sel1 repeat family protein n=1 Tax=Yoonia phaeophyticola TaxID=3137369 RepID=A0ABZ2V7I2_9RHOB